MVNKIKIIFKGKTHNSTLLYATLKLHSDIKEYAEQIFSKYPEYESIGRVIISIVEDKYLKNCLSCGKLISWTRCQKQNSRFCSVKCASSSTERKLKIKKTCLEKYGVDNPAKLAITQQKMQKTSFSRYGVKNYNSTIECKEKKKKTFLSRYGVSSNFSRPEVRIKLQKYYQNTFKSDHLKTSFYYKNIIFNKIIIERLTPNNIIPLFGVNKYRGTYNGKKVQHYMFKCLLCNREFESYLSCGYIPICKCKQFKSFSKGEKEVLNYIKSIYPGIIIENERTQIFPYELDIFLPDLKIGIEYNGEYWHKLKEQKNPGCHKLKAKLCKEKGIKLINISEQVF